MSTSTEDLASHGQTLCSIHTKGLTFAPVPTCIQVVMYPKSMRLVMTLMDEPRNQIYPPVLYIT